MGFMYAHPDARVESSCIGDGTRIWGFTHVMKGACVGRNCNIGEHCFVEAGCIVGDDVTIKNGNMLWEGVVLEHGVFVGPQALFTNDLRPRSPRLSQAEQRYQGRQWLKSTVVREGASVGAGAILLGGITVGAYAMIGAGAVVTHDVPAFGLVIGSPARVVGWVCECGSRLRFEGSHGTCAECLLEFEKCGDQVQPDQSVKSCLKSPPADVKNGSV